MTQVRAFTEFLQLVAQVFSIGVFSAAALVLGGWALLAGTGVLPWPMIDAATPIAGQTMLIAATVLSLGLLGFLPGSWRVLRLENGHRQFDRRMEDGARAYHIAHAADRAGVFRAASEFDAVKARILHLRAHPDLSSLEPEVLELAARMSFTSADLARIYSDENVARAQKFLAERAAEIERFNAWLDRAKVAHAQLRTQLTRVELDEAVAQSDRDRLRDEIEALLVGLPVMPPRTSPATLISMPALAAE